MTVTSTADSLESIREETVTKKLNVVVLPNDEVYLTTLAQSILTLPSRTKRKHIMVFNVSKARDNANMFGMTPSGTEQAISTQSPTTSWGLSDYYKEYTTRQSRTDTSFHEITKTFIHRLTPTIALIRNNFFTIRATKIIIRAPPPQVMVQRGYQAPPRVIIRPIEVTRTVTMMRIITVCPRMLHRHAFAAREMPFEWSHHHRHPHVPQSGQAPMIPMPPIQPPVPSECHPRDPNDVLPKPNNNVN